jgi:hypothetical protein
MESVTMKQIFRMILALTCLSLATDARTWTSLSGKQLEAEYVATSADLVTLKSLQGEMFSIPLAKLSPGDQNYIRNQKPQALQPGMAALAPTVETRAGSPKVAAQMVPGQTFTRTADGETAVNYHVRVPASFNPAHPPPLVIAFSPGGKGQSILNAIGTSTDRAGWIAIGCDKLKNGMDGGKLEEKMEDEVLEDIYRNIPHDPRRIYLAGHSGGAMRAYGIAARRKEPFAGILAFGGWLGGKEFQKKPYCQYMAVAMVNGDQDESSNSWAQGDAKALENSKCHVKQFSFPGGHPMTASPEVTDQCLRWLQEDWETKTGIVKGSIL